MRVRWVLGAGLLSLLLGVGMSDTVSSAEPMSTPTINGLTATPASVTTLYGGSTISASVAHTNSCALTAKPAVLAGNGKFACSKTTPVARTLEFPENMSNSAVVYKITLKAIGNTGTAGEVKQSIDVSVAPGAGGLSPLSGVKSVVADDDGFTFCALLTSGAVDCWGDGSDGELGNGTLNTESTTPVPVKGVGGGGTLGGVASLTANDEVFCALLTSGGVDCWGAGGNGELGDGSFSDSATPVPVEGVGGTDTLGGVASLTGSTDTLCARLATGKVDCWGDGFFGELGNGVFYNGQGNHGSATPVQVDGLGGSGVLGSVASLAGSVNSFCAVLASGAVDCWGYGYYGDLGNGSTSIVATPVQVDGVGGTGTLGGVASLADGFDGYCALLTSGGVDCWGRGDQGELGNGSMSGSTSPVRVDGVGGTGTLIGVASLTGNFNSYCVILTSGGVDCWGYGEYGQLGDGSFYPSGYHGSDTPVGVEGVGGTGTLGGVSSLGVATYAFCALVTSGELDCWGYGPYGELGNGVVYGSYPYGRDTPAPVKGVGGNGTTLTGVASVNGSEASDTFCALLTSSAVDCWGDNSLGELGDGSTKEYSAKPVPVASS
jgi:alpha-tubulin suppressor-like RCC1 family protein